jgi:hypothetical protein
LIRIDGRHKVKLIVGGSECDKIRSAVPWQPVASSVRKMTSIVQRAAARRRRCSFSLAAALTCGLAATANAEVRVEGSPTAVRVTTSHDAIADVLSAFAATFNVQYRTAILLDAPANKTYSGSFGQVVSRLLEGYNYVLKKDQETIEIIISGRRGEVAILPPATKAPPTQGILSRWR